MSHLFFREICYKKYVINNNKNLILGTYFIYFRYNILNIFMKS